MIRLLPLATRPDTLCPYTTLVPSVAGRRPARLRQDAVPGAGGPRGELAGDPRRTGPPARSEEHTSELQSLMRISYAVFCLKKKKTEFANSRRSMDTTAV